MKKSKHVKKEAKPKSSPFKVASRASRRHIEQLPSSASTGAGAHGKKKDRVKKKLNFDKAADDDDDDDDDSTAGHAPNKLSKSEAEKRFMVTLSANFTPKKIRCPKLMLP